MATKKEVKKTTKMDDHKYRRQKLREAMAVMKADSGELARNIQEVEGDPFSSFYGKYQLLTPPYDLARLYTIYEESDILQTCVDAMRKNVDGFGYKLQFTGDDKQKDDPIPAAEREALENFFDQVNEKQSFATVRKRMREDFEVLGNGAVEVLRNIKGNVQLMYYAPFKNIRISSLRTPPVTMNVSILRNGAVQRVRVRRKFRKFVQLDAYGKKLVWFKEFGDPRTMDYRTGEFTKKNIRTKATEIWHFKMPFGGSPYGLPRWIGAVLQVLGRRSAQYVNHDLFEHQGIAPMAVMVSGGVLTDDSLDELEAILRGLRGVENWNRVMLLESNVEGVGLDDKGSAKIELKNLSEYRSEDQMFDRYLTATEKDVRHRYRLPDLYVGQSETFTHATAKAAQTIAEEQVFIPERMSFDEMVNLELVSNEFEVDDWKYRSRGPRISGAADISKGVETFAKAGAFTINHAIEQANEAFGLEMSKYEEAWSNYPVAIVLEMVKQGTLKDTEAIGTAAETVTGQIEQVGGPANQPLLPAPTEKLLKSDIFTPDEQSLYKLLVTIQNGVEKGVFSCNVPELPDNSLESEGAES